MLITINGEKILVVGDLHLGYDEAMRDAGYLIPGDLYKQIIMNFDKIFDKIDKVEKIILLGDVKHYFGKIAREEWEEVTRLTAYLKKRSKELIIIKGNHDKLIEPVAEKANVRIFDYYILNNFCFVHGDNNFKENKEIWGKKIDYIVMGHAHPAVIISDNIKTEKYKCFLIGNYKGKKIIIVPSFFPLKEGSDIRETDIPEKWRFKADKFEVKIVGEDLEVLEFGRLGNIKNNSLRS